MAINFQKKAGELPRLFHKYADTNGDGSGTTNANGDYSSSQGVFKVTAGEGQILRVTRLMWTLMHSAPIARPDHYGGLSAALSNGVQIRVSLDNTTSYNLTSTPIKSNADWASYSYDMRRLAWSTSKDAVFARWTFEHSGFPVRLTQDQSIEVVLNDNFTGTDTQYFVFEGHFESL